MGWSQPTARDEAEQGGSRPVGESSWHGVLRSSEGCLSPFWHHGYFYLVCFSLTCRHGEQADGVCLVRAPAAEQGSGAAELLRTVRKHGGWDSLPSGSHLHWKVQKAVS